MGGINACYLEILFQNSCRIIAQNDFRRNFQSVSAQTLSQEEKLKKKPQALPVWGQLRQARASLVIFDRVTYLFQGPKQNNAYKKQTLVRSIWIRTEEGKKIHNSVDDIFFFIFSLEIFLCWRSLNGGILVIVYSSCYEIVNIVVDISFCVGCPRFLDHVSLWVFLKDIFNYWCLFR